MSTAPARLREFLPDARELALLFAARGVAGALAWHAGFRALSDDDYARITIAQRFAHAPRIDPSGTSWLPAPFWIYGTALRSFGNSLAVARATAVVAGLAATVLVYLAARLLGTSKGAAMLAAALSCLVLQYSTLLGIAAVPEVPCAALILVALATSTRPEPALRAWGGLSLAMAALSRYEAWPVALAYVGYCVWDARRRRQSSLLWGAALAAAGPALWLLLGRIEHGDALFFIARVTSYRRALGGGSSSLAERVGQYPLALLTNAPELVGLLLLLWFIAPKRRPGEGLPLARGALSLLALLAFLVLGSVRDGVPTHHAARVLLPIWFFGCVVAGQLFSVIESGRRSRALVVVLFSTSSALFLLARVAKEGFAERSPELEAGRAARQYGGGRLAIDTPDYGYFAVQAAFGDPAATSVLQEHDPRRRVEDPFRSAAVLDEALRGTHADFVLLTEEHRPLLDARCADVWHNDRFVLARCSQPVVPPRTSPL